MFLHYLINVWKTKQSWLKKTPALRGWLTCTCSYGKCSSRLGEISAKSSEISPMRAGSLLIWAHYIFIGVSFKEDEISPRRASPPNLASSPPYEQRQRREFNDQKQPSEVLFKIDVLKNLAYLTYIFYICLIKKGLQYRCFPVKLKKFHSHKKRKDSLETQAELAVFLYNLSSKNY